MSRRPGLSISERDELLRIGDGLACIPIESAVRYWRGSGGLWKGRVQAT
jgi:hypothetical protein